MPGGRLDARVADLAEPLGLLDPRLDLADAGQVLVELVLVLGVEPALHRAGVVEDEVEDRPLLLPAALQVRPPLAGRAGAEEPLEDQPRVGLRRHRRRRRAPGEVVLVGAGIAGVAGPGLPARVAGQLQRGEAREVADLAGDHLVDRDAGADVGGALLQADAGQERAVAARVVAGAVGPAVGRPVVQAAEDLDQALERLQRLERPLELEVGPLAARPPGGGDGAVGEVDEGRPQRRAGGGRRPGRPSPVGGEQPGRAQRRERRQRDRGAQAAEEVAAAEAVAGRCEAVGVEFLRSWSGPYLVELGRPAGVPVREVRGLRVRRSAALLERGGFDDARDQGGGAAALAFSSRSTIVSTASTSYDSRPRPRA